MATLTTIRPAEAIPVIRMAIQRTASISKMAVVHETHWTPHYKMAGLEDSPESLQHSHESAFRRLHGLRRLQ
jgi:hypothetical protein